MKTANEAVIILVKNMLLTLNLSTPINFSLVIIETGSSYLKTVYTSCLMSCCTT